jgi:hypothetical protein
MDKYGDTASPQLRLLNEKQNYPMKRLRMVKLVVSL